MGLKESGLRGSLRNTSSVIPAFFDVTITNTNSPVQEGDILTVDYSADNTGDAQDMQDIRLEIDSVQEDVDPGVMLAGGASTTGTLEWDTTGEPEAEYTATVLSDDDSDSVIVEIGSAIPDAVVLQPETDDLQHFSGDTDVFDINDSQPRIGDLSVKGSSDDFGRIVSQSGLDNYVSKGVSSSCLINPNSDGIAHVIFAAQDVDNYMFIEINDSGDGFRIRKKVNGDTSTLNETSISIDATDFHLVYWDWHDASASQPDNEIVAKLFEVDQNDGSIIDDDNPIASVSANDDQFAEETGVGLEDSNSSVSPAFERYLTNGPLGAL